MSGHFFDGRARRSTIRCSYRRARSHRAHDAEARADDDALEEVALVTELDQPRVEIELGAVGAALEVRELARTPLSEISSEPSTEIFE